MNRIYLSPPHLGDVEDKLVDEALSSGWIAPAGPQVEAFEQEFSRMLGVNRSLAVASGTAALHLALRLSGVGPGDEVLCSDLTFVASANPILYQGARPVFIDSHPATWTMDPEKLEEYLVGRARFGRLPKAAVVVDLFGQCADYEPILASCGRFGVPVIEDAAEALGATYREKQAGTLGHFGAFSFNGNKIITTSGGGMLICRDPSLVEKARFLSGHAREPGPCYQHSVLGYNYKMSNILAAIGRAQLRVLDQRIQQRRGNFEMYRAGLADLQGVSFMPEATYGRSTRWLTCIELDPERTGSDPNMVRKALEEENIEARQAWKPMHLQTLFRGCEVVGGRVSEQIFRRGLCLPSGSNLAESDIQRVIGIVRRCILG